MRIKWDCNGCEHYQMMPWNQRMRWNQRMCQKNIGDGENARKLGILESELVFCPRYVEEMRVLNKCW